MGYNEQQLFFEVYLGFETPRGILIFLFPFCSFLFFLFFCLSLLLITQNSTLFSVLYCQIMSRPWHSPPLQTVKPKNLHLATLRQIQQPPSLSRKGRFGERDPNLTHCSAPPLTHSSHLLDWVSYWEKEFHLLLCFLYNCFLKMQDNMATWR